MSLTTELEGLLKEREQLKNMWQSLDEEEKFLGKRLRIVEEKLAVQDLKGKIMAKRAVVDQLKSKIRELEKRLEEPQKKEPIKVTVKAAPTSNQQPKNQQENKKRWSFP